MTVTSRQSPAFNLLDERVRRWIYRQKWSRLRDIQEEAVLTILQEKADVIIAAATASGKTEAAFLPICSDLVSQAPASGSVLYVSPLKALINDQFERLFDLCEALEVPVYPWHGDISPGKKKGFFQNRQGIVLITPESLEAMFVNNGNRIGEVFAFLRYVVIDELHAFIGDERGRQTQSLLHRLERRLERKVTRIGLSATLGDMATAKSFLRPRQGDNVKVIISNESRQELKLLLRGFLVNKETKTAKRNAEHGEVTDADTLSEPNGSLTEPKDKITNSLFQSLRGTSNLVFANSRRNVELYAANLRSCCICAQIPNEFYPHHGSLHKNIREEAETAIKDKSAPTTIVCTSTLEMGIDIGAVDSVAQVGVPPSVAGLRQRLGRSGRRGNAAVLQMYIEEHEQSALKNPVRLLRNDLVQSIAMLNLLLTKWCEPPEEERLHLSTLVQQILSLIAEHNGITALEAWQVLIETGPFQLVTQSQFVELLRAMGAGGLLAQAANGLLLLGPEGERIVNRYDFYTAFITPGEYRLVAEGVTIGTLPIKKQYKEGAMLIFAGERWTVIAADNRRKLIELKPAKDGSPPVFGGDGGEVHGRVREEMRRIYLGEEKFDYLDQVAEELLREGRESFRRFGLEERSILSWGEATYLFPWVGDKTGDTIAAILSVHGLTARNWGLAIEVKAGEDEVLAALGRVAEGAMPGGEELVKWGEGVGREKEKYDSYLTEDLLVAECAAARFDVPGARFAVKRMGKGRCSVQDKFQSGV